MQSACDVMMIVGGAVIIARHLVVDVTPRLSSMTASGSNNGGGNREGISRSILTR